MTYEVWYYFLACLLLLGNCLGLVGTLFAMPGNWLIVLLTALFAWYPSRPEGPGVTWLVVGVVVLLAALGELIEFVASAAGAARHGASRRAVVLALGGSLTGAFGGAIVAAPVPIVGLPVGALLGGAVGAYVGAVLGEMWKGKAVHETRTVAQAAFVGRLLGSLGKLVVGAVMVVIVSLDAFLG